MHILKLTLKQFGRHAEIDADLNGPVIGIIGPNGSGKSTVLQAVRFALTGYLEDDRESYVRNWDPTNKDAPTNGSVRLEFEKDGQRGVIFRQLGKSPRQSLEWDGKTVKAVKDIDTVLADVLGADRQALDHAVFIPQGSFDKLLFGSAAEREQLYSRLFLVSFCERLSTLAAEKAKILVGSLRDLTALSDEVNAQVREATKNLMDLDQAARARPPIPKDVLAPYETYRTLVAEHASKRREHWPLIDEIKKAGTLVEQARQSLANLGISDIREADVRMSEIADRLSKGDTQQAFHQAHLRAKKRLADAISELSTAQQKFQAALVEVGKHQANVLPLNKKSELRQQAVSIRKYIGAALQKPTLEKAKADKEKLISEGQVELSALEKKSSELHTEGSALAGQLAPLKLALELVERVQKTKPTAHTGSSTVCPVCQSTIEARLISAARVSELQSMIGPLESRLMQARQNYSMAQKQAAELTGRVGGYRQELLQIEKSLGEISQVLDDPNLHVFGLSTEDDAKKLEAEANLSDLTEQFHLPNARRVQADAARLFQLATEAKASAEAELAAAEKDAPKDYEPAKWEDQKNTLSAEKANISTLRATKVAADEMLRNVTQNKANVERRLEELRILIGTAYSSAISHPIIADFFRMLESDPEGTPESADQACARINELIAEYQRSAQDMASRFEQQRLTLQGLETRKRGIDAGMAENDKQRVLSEEMKAVSQLFSRDGLPMAYMRSRFSEIAELTSQYLANLDSSFIVRPSQARAVTFEFLRIDEGGADVWMDQKKLSGGQRVRLTVAFLLAVQRAVLPDVGLLVLDEPTMHLDDAGKESLAALLQSLAATFNSGEAQILVCDHAPEIKDGLTRFIALS